MLGIFSSIKVKLFSAVALLTLVVLVVGGLGLANLSWMNDQLSEVVNVTSTKQLLATRSQRALVALHRAEKNLILADTDEAMDGHAADIARYEKELQEQLEKMAPLATDDNRRLIGEFNDSFKKFTDVNRQVRDLSRQNTNKQAEKLSDGEGQAIFNRIETLLVEIADRNDKEVSELIRQAKDSTADESVRNKLTAADDAATRALLSTRIMAQMIAMQRAEKNFILAQSEVDMKRHAKSIDDRTVDVNKQLARINETATDQNKAVLARFVELQNQWLANNSKVRDLSLQNTNQRAFDLSTKTGSDLLEEAENKLADISKMADDSMNKASATGAAAYASARWVMILTTLLGLAAAGTMALLVIRKLVKSLNIVIAQAKDIAEGEGDLTKRIPVESKDEIGELGMWFNKFVQKIHDVIGEVAASASEVASAATQIASSSEEMASGMNEQTDQVTQISSAIEEMSASIVEVARKSSEAAGNASESGKIAETGGQAVTRTVEGMKSISDAVSASAASVQKLGERGEQIGAIIEVINDIADQTNLLALNAAIEAARAGEHGRGFAVVADEVRKLADRTTKATEEIGESIQAIQTETTGAVERMNTGTGQVQQGVQLATSAGDNLVQIVQSAKDVAQMIQSIAAAAEEQSSASEQVSRNVEAISAVTRQASEGASQAASAASQLSNKAEQLQRLVGQFKLAGKKAA